jgi:hypothetical protein
MWIRYVAAGSKWGTAVNWKWCGRVRSWPVLRYHHCACRLRLRIAACRFEMRTQSVELLDCGSLLNCGCFSRMGWLISRQTKLEDDDWWTRRVWKPAIVAFRKEPSLYASATHFIESGPAQTQWVRCWFARPVADRDLGLTGCVKLMCPPVDNVFYVIHAQCLTAAVTKSIICWGITHYGR